MSPPDRPDAVYELVATDESPAVTGADGTQIIRPVGIPSASGSGAPTISLGN